METQTFDPRKIAESLEAETETESFQETMERISEALTEEEKDYNPKISPKMLANASVRGLELRAMVRNEKRAMYLNDNPFFNNKTKKPFKKIPIQLPNLDSLMRNAPLRVKNKLRPKHLPVIEAFLFEGKSQEDIAKEFGLSRSAVHQILQSPSVTDFLNRNKEALSKEYQVLGRKAVSNMRDFLKDTDKDTRLKATTLYLKRADFTPQQEMVHKVQGSGEHGEIIVDFKRSLLKKAGISEEVIEAEFKRLPEESSNGNGNGSS